MEWRETVRKQGWIARQAERAVLRLAQVNEEYLAILEKLEVKSQAASAVHEHKQYLEHLVSMHQMCSPTMDWRSRANEPPPPEPCYTDKNEREARLALEHYKAPFLLRLLKQPMPEKQRLSDAVDAAARKDQLVFLQAVARYPRQQENHQDLIAFAERVLSGDPPTLLEAVKLFEPLSSIHLLGEDITLKISNEKILSVVLNVCSENVIPSKQAQLLPSGRASVTTMSDHDYGHLCQNHFCSASLRIARELLAFLPIDEVIVTVVDEIRSPEKGQHQKIPVLSFHADRSIMETLDFTAMDACSLMQNFIHRMRAHSNGKLLPITPF